MCEAGTNRPQQYIVYVISLVSATQPVTTELLLQPSDSELIAICHSVLLGYRLQLTNSVPQRHLYKCKRSST